MAGYIKVIPRTQEVKFLLLYFFGCKHNFLHPLPHNSVTDGGILYWLIYSLIILVVVILCVMLYPKKYSPSIKDKSVQIKIFHGF